MSNKLYEIAFLLSAKSKSNFNSTFKEADKSVKGLNEKIHELNKQKIDIDKYQSLQNSIEQTAESGNELKKSAETMSREVGDSNRSFDEQRKRVKQAQDALDQYKLELSEVDKVSEQQRQTRRKLAETLQEEKKKFRELGNENKVLNTQMMKLTKEITKSDSAIKKQEISLQKLGEKLKIAGVDTKKLGEHNSDLAKKIEEAAKQQERFNQVEQGKVKAKGNIVGMSAGLASVGSFAASFGMPIKEAMAFESAMADVKKVVDFKTPEQFKTMQKDIVGLSKKIPMTKEELASIVAAGGQSGIADDELIGYAQNAAKMGVAFDVAASEAGQMMAQWQTAFKMDQSSVVSLADQINYLGNTTAASAPKIAEVVTRIGPLGDVGGVASNEIAALGASMIGVGIQEEVAATGIKNLILNLVKGEKATKSQKDAFNKLGMSAVDVSKAMQEDAQGAILSVLEAMNKLPKDEQAATLNALFGSESIGAISPLLTNLDALKDNMDKVADATSYAGSMEAEFAARSATSENKAILRNNSLKALATTIGDMLLPVVNKTNDTIIRIADGTQAFVEKHPGISKLIVMMVGGLAGITAAGLATGIMINMVKFSALSAKGAFASWNVVTTILTGGQKLLNLALMANPATKVVMGIMLLAVALTTAYNKSETFRNVVNKTTSGLIEFVSGGVDFAKSSLEKFDALISKIKVPQWVYDFSNMLSGIGDKVKSIDWNPFNNKSDKVGKNATGTNYWRGGLTMVGERGPELVNLPKGSQVVPNNKTIEMVNNWDAAPKGSGGEFKFIYNPTIQVSSASKQEIEMANQQMLAEFKKVAKETYNECLRQQKRLALG